MQRVVGIVFLFSSLFGLWTTIQNKRSAQALANAIASGDPSYAVKAIRFNVGNAEAHYIASSLLARNGESAAALDELRTAVLLRPNHFQLWLELGGTLAEKGNNSAALESFQQAISRAPFYAQPRWQMGTLLLSMGQTDEAFKHLALAGTSDPALFLNVVQLAWKEYGGRPEEIEKVVGPKTAHDRIRLAQFFVWRGYPDHALNVFRRAGQSTAKDRAYLVNDLLSGKHFAQAYQVHIDERKDASKSGLGSIEDPGFETPISFNQGGFGWKFARDAGAVRILFDKSNPNQGDHSLRLDWHGNTNVSVPTLSQLVLTEPELNYRLHFYVRSDNLLSGTPPFIGVTDASNNEKMLGQTQSLAAEKTWQRLSLEFATTANTNAIRIVMQRPRCAEPACPIFGRLWLDNFSLEKINSTNSNLQ